MYLVAPGVTRLFVELLLKNIDGLLRILKRPVELELAHQSRAPLRRQQPYATTICDGHAAKHRTQWVRQKYSSVPLFWMTCAM